MKRRTLNALIAFAFGATLAVSAHAQQTTLRVFSGGQNQRPDLMRKLFLLVKKTRKVSQAHTSQSFLF